MNSSTKQVETAVIVKSTKFILELSAREMLQFRDMVMSNTKADGNMVLTNAVLNGLNISKSKPEEAKQFVDNLIYFVKDNSREALDEFKNQL